MKSSHAKIGTHGKAGHCADTVRDAITRSIATLPEGLRPWLSRDGGTEMAQHARLKVDTGMQV